MRVECTIKGDRGVLRFTAADEPPAADVPEHVAVWKPASGTEEIATTTTTSMILRISIRSSVLPECAAARSYAGSGCEERVNWQPDKFYD